MGRRRVQRGRLCGRRSSRERRARRGMWAPELRCCNYRAHCNSNSNRDRREGSPRGRWARMGLGLVCIPLLQLLLFLLLPTNGASRSAKEAVG